VRRTVLLAVLVAAVGGIGVGSASAACDPKYRPLCLSDCPGELPDAHDPTDTSWLVRACPDGTASKAGSECETAARCVGYCANQRLDPDAAVSWTNGFVACVS
jgi:hypothetical protein